MLVDTTLYVHVHVYYVCTIDTCIHSQCMSVVYCCTCTVCILTACQSEAVLQNLNSVVFVSGGILLTSFATEVMHVYTH